MSRLKKEILNKLKEYAGKMGRDHLGGDDYTSKKKGGLRDFDGYDNVDYNQDMPMDEMQVVNKKTGKDITKHVLALLSGKIDKKKFEKLTGLKKEASFTPNSGTKSGGTHGLDSRKYELKRDVKGVKIGDYTNITLPKGTIIYNIPGGVFAHHRSLKSYESGQNKYFNKSTFRGISVKREKNTILSIEKNSKILESVNEAKVNYNFSEDELKRVLKLLGRNASTEVKMIKAFEKAFGRKLTRDELFESINEAMKPSQVRSAISKVKKQLMRKWKQKGGYENFGQKELDKMKSKFDYNPYGSPDERQISKMLDGFDNWAMNYDGNMRESINEVGVNVWYFYKKANKNKNKFFNMLSDFRKKHSDTAWIKMLNYALEDFNENPKKYKTIDDKQNILFKNLQNNKKVYEGMFSTIDQIRQDSKDVRDFVKNVFKDREFKKMSNDKDFIKYLKSIYEGVSENSGISNWMQGRTSDYHTALRGKNKDYSGGTNFKKKNHGQPDVEEDDEDQETNHLSNKQLHVKAKLKVAESGKKKSDKNYKDWKSTNEGFDKIEHLSLLNKALRAIPGSPKQKNIIRKLNVVRKAGGMRPLKEQSIVEYASRLTLSYIADKDSKLDGTPEDIKAIDEKAERDYKDEYKKFQSSKKSKKYRAELNKYNRDKGTYGNGDGKDASHKGGKIVGFESASKNRGRKEKSRLKKENVAPNHNDKSAPYGSGYKKVNEVGVFPVTNYIKGIIPQGRLDTNTPEAKRKSAKLVGDLKKTLNTFWKQHDIPFKIK